MKIERIKDRCEICERREECKGHDIDECEGFVPPENVIPLMRLVGHILKNLLAVFGLWIIFVILGNRIGLPMESPAVRVMYGILYVGLMMLMW